MKSGASNRIRCRCFVFIVSICSICGTLSLTEQSQASAANGNNQLNYLDLEHRSLSQALESTQSGVEDKKFLQIDVVKVFNPKRYALSFAVHYQPENAPRILLGSFALYPADNPGIFIVPTQGKLKRRGAITVSLDIVDQVKPGDTVRVEVKKIRFLDSR